MSNKIYQITLTEQQRDALIQMQLIGSALALTVEHKYSNNYQHHPLYSEWSKLLNIVQPVLWWPLQMNR
jgi:hypothetical protein